MGYQSFWVAETVGTEAFATLAAVGAAHPGLGLGTGVLAAPLRTPPLTAMGAATLQDLHPDVDVLLGVGASSPAVVTRWHGAAYGADRPLARMREYLTLLRECLSGEKVDFDGDFHRVKGFRLGVRLGERRPKIILAALNPGMLRLGGELADGVLLNYLPASHVPWSVEQVRAGGDATVYAYVHVGVTDAEAPTVATPAATSSPTPWSTPTPPTSNEPVSPTRSPRSGAATPPATATARWPPSPTACATPSTCSATPSTCTPPSGPTPRPASTCLS